MGKRKGGESNRKECAQYRTLFVGLLLDFLVTHRLWEKKRKKDDRKRCGRKKKEWEIGDEGKVCLTSKRDCALFWSETGQASKAKKPTPLKRKIF